MGLLGGYLQIVLHFFSHWLEYQVLEPIIDSEWRAGACDQTAKMRRMTPFRKIPFQERVA
jgi:hypothetical protein